MGKYDGEKRGSLRPQDIAAINVAPKPLKGVESSVISTQANALAAVRHFDMPVVEQAKVDPRPHKAQSMRSMQRERDNEYVDPEAVAKFERDIRAAQARQARKDERNFLAAWNASSSVIEFVHNGKAITPVKERVPSSRKPRVKTTTKVKNADDLAQIERLRSVGYAPRKFVSSDRVGKAS